LRLEGELLAPLLRGGDGNEVAAFAAAVGDFIRDAVLGELEVPLRHGIRRVEDRVVDDDGIHGYQRTTNPTAAKGP